MKRAFLIAATFCCQIAVAQSPVTAKIRIINEITTSPVDAELQWYDAALVKRIERGNYHVELGYDREEKLSISRDGYFDSQITLDYSTIKTNPDVEVILQPSVPRLDITIQSAETEEVVPSAIDLFTLDESTEIFSEEVETSPYTIDLEYDKVLVLQVRSAGFFSFKDTIDFRGVFEGRTRKRQISLVPLKAGNKIALNNIYFKENEAHLTDFAKLMLVELTHVLEQQNGLVIEIGAYTDDLGSDQYNLELSQRRAAAVKTYLIEKGAKATQLQTKGYGEASPVVPNSNEENRALNRRVEFKILKVS